jgi:hypothetical protein
MKKILLFASLIFLSALISGCQYKIVKTDNVGDSRKAVVAPQIKISTTTVDTGGNSSSTKKDVIVNPKSKISTTTVSNSLSPVGTKNKIKPKNNVVNNQNNNFQPTDFVPDVTSAPASENNNQNNEKSPSQDIVIKEYCDAFANLSAIIKTEVSKKNDDNQVWSYCERAFNITDVDSQNTAVLNENPDYASCAINGQAEARNNEAAAKEGLYEKEYNSCLLISSLKNTIEDEDRYIKDCKDEAVNKTPSLISSVCSSNGSDLACADKDQFDQTVGKLIDDAHRELSASAYYISYVSCLTTDVNSK